MDGALGCDDLGEFRLIQLWVGSRRSRFHVKVLPEHHADLAAVRWFGVWRGRLVYARSRRWGHMHRHLTGTRGLGYSVVVDHRNGDPLDNRYPGNLFPTTQFVNRWNVNHGEMRGVRWIPDRGAYKVTIPIDGRSVHLGFIRDKMEAIELRQLHQKRVCGFEVKNTFTKLNWCGCYLNASKLTQKIDYGTKIHTPSPIATDFLSSIAGSAERAAELERAWKRNRPLF